MLMEESEMEQTGDRGEISAENRSSGHCLIGHLSDWASPTHLDVIGLIQKWEPEMEVLPLPVLWNSFSAARQIIEC